MNQNTSTRSRRNQAKRNQNVITAGDQLLLKALDRIERLEETQTPFAPPTIPDVLPMVLKRDKPHTFARSYAGAQIVSSNLSDTVGGIVFQLGLVPNYTEFTTLFDEFRILQAKIEFDPLTSASTAPPLYTAIDYDDGTVPSSVNELRQYESLMTVPSNRYFRRVLNPKASAAYYQGSFTGFGSSYGPWLDTGSYSVQHYGLKYILPQTATPNAATYNVNITLVFQCRNVF